jgi:hypothetical protein
MRNGKILVWLGVGVFSGLLMSQAVFADGGFYGRRGEIRHERRELGRDWRELNHDRGELRRDFRRGAPASEIAGERAEIRHDWQELAHDRRELGSYRGWDRDGDRDDGYRYQPYRRGWYDRDDWWRPYWR